MEVLEAAIREGQLVLASHIVLTHLMSGGTLDPSSGDAASRRSPRLANFDTAHLDSLLDTLETWTRERAARGTLLRSLKDRATIAVLDRAGRIDEAIRRAACEEVEKQPEALDRWLALCFADPGDERGPGSFAALFPPGESTSALLMKRSTALGQGGAEIDVRPWIEKALGKASGTTSDPLIDLAS